MHSPPQAAADETTGATNTQANTQALALRWRVNLLGAIALAAYGSMTVLSFVLAPALWRGHPDSARALAFFDALAGHLSIVALSRAFETSTAAIICYFVPLLVATLTTVLLVVTLHRNRGGSDAGLVRLLLRWSLAFAAVSFFAVPIFTQDFWLSAVWGRMVATGQNPYHQLFTPDMLAGLPLDHFPMLMSYGPAWAILSGAVMAIAGENLLVIAILFKVILSVAWIGALVLIDKITAARSAHDRCLAITVFGWLPLGMVQTVAEGHNDIIMAVLALLWLLLLIRGRWSSPIMLVVSAMSKYVTAPLFVVDVIATLRLRPTDWRAFALRMIAPTLLGIALLAVFFRSPQFFDGTRTISEWHFLQPRNALWAIDRLVPFSVYPIELAISIAFAGIALRCLIALYKEPIPDNIVKAALAIMCVISFVGIAHLWPWYLVWMIGLAALVPAWWLSRFVIGVTILAPFTLAFWWIEPLIAHQEAAALALYIGALMWVYATRAGSGIVSEPHSAGAVVKPW